MRKKPLWGFKSLSRELGQAAEPAELPEPLQSVRDAEEIEVEEVVLEASHTVAHTIIEEHAVKGHRVIRVGLNEHHLRTRGVVALHPAELLFVHGSGGKSGGKDGAGGKVRGNNGAGGKDGAGGIDLAAKPGGMAAKLAASMALAA
eukprot:gene1687-biopygen12058